MKKESINYLLKLLNTRGWVVASSFEKDDISSFYKDKYVYFYLQRFEMYMIINPNIISNSNKRNEVQKYGC